MIMMHVIQHSFYPSNNGHSRHSLKETAPSKRTAGDDFDNAIEAPVSVQASRKIAGVYNRRRTLKCSHDFCCSVLAGTSRHGWLPPREPCVR
mmetsp:Transcript_16936/g.36537  ORF Transcript_16936/g.36537 Transcript_16936/m.36537 type:complete len:92 (-) Transcript_16936:80-355(-)